MSQRKSTQDERIAAAEAAVRVYLYSAHLGAVFYRRQADHCARCAMRTRTVEQARKDAQRAAAFTAKAEELFP
jgi:hypothetical protein